MFVFQTKRISGAGKMQAKFEKYQKNAYVVCFMRRSHEILDFYFSEQGQFNQDQASTIPHKRHSDFGGRGGANKRFKSGNVNKSFVV